MSVSSGSDVTIPIQDSPPPPPSPYANRVSETAKTNPRSTPEPRRDVTGIENKGFNSDTEIMKGSENKKPHTEINMANGGEVPNLNEAVNSELINMNIMNTIPAKPQSEFRPYEPIDTYFMPVNTHKKFLGRSEKLYVTKDKRKESQWKKYLCWTFGAFLLAVIVAVSVLAAVGIIPQNSDPEQNNIIGISTPSSIIQPETYISTTSSTTTTTTLRPPTISPDNNYVPMAAIIEFHITNMHYEAALHNKSSEQFASLSSKIQPQMKELLRDKANLEGVQIRINEFAPGSILVKMRIGWMDETMDFDTIQFRLANVTSFGEFEIRPMSSYKVVNYCKFNNHGCSHFCTYDFESLEFLCTCPETMLLDTDSKKTCKDSIIPSSSSPLTTEVSSVEPSSEPEIISEDSTSVAEPEPEPEIIQEEASEAPIHSSSAIPIGNITQSSESTSTTGAPRLDEIDISVAEDKSEAVETTVAPIIEEPVPVSEAPTDSESSIDIHNHGAILASSTSTTTTEVPLILEAPIENESNAPNEDEPLPETPAHDDLTNEHVPLVVETTLAPATAEEEEVPIVPEVVVPETTPKPDEPETPVVEPSQEPASPVETEQVKTLTEQAEIGNPIALDILISSTTTTTESPTLSTSSTAASPVLIPELEETQSQPEEPLLSNLQRDSSIQSQESSVESPEATSSVEFVVPTNQPTSNEDNKPDEENNEQFEPIESPSSRISNSSERTGRQETYVEQVTSGYEETTIMPAILSHEPIRPSPGSAEFMVFGDTHPASGQTSVVGLHNSKELTGSDEVGSSSVGSSDEAVVLPTPSSSENLQASREIEETTTFKSISLHSDIHVNHLDNVTEDSIHSENLENPSGENKAAKDNLNEDIRAETTEISIEHEDVERANRDHRETTEAVDSTFSPVVFEEESVTSDPSEVDSTSTSTTPSLTVASSPLTTAKTPIENNTDGNESENELS